MTTERNKGNRRHIKHTARKVLMAVFLLVLFTGSLMKTSLAAQVPDMEDEGYEYLLEEATPGQFGTSLKIATPSSLHRHGYIGGDSGEVATPSGLSRSAYRIATPGELATPSNLLRKPGVQLPMTGGIGLLWFWTFSMGIFACAVWLFRRRNDC